MAGFAQIMRDVTDGLMAKPDGVGLIVLMALVNRVDARLVTTIGAYGIAEKTHLGQLTVERKLIQFVEWGWLRVHPSVDPYRLNRIVLKMVAPNIVAPVFGKHEGEVLRMWNEVFKADKSLIGKDGQRYRLDDSQTTAKQKPNANPNENQTASPDQALALNAEGDDRLNPRHYTQEEYETEFADESERSNAVGYSLAEISLAETNAVGTTGVARNNLEGKSLAISEVSMADLTMRVKNAAPDLTVDEVHRIILNSGADTVERVLTMMRSSKKPIQKPAGYIKSMCTRLSNRTPKADTFDPLDGKSYLTGKYAHLYNP